MYNGHDCFITIYMYPTNLNPDGITVKINISLAHLQYYYFYYYCNLLHYNTK